MKRISKLEVVSTVSLDEIKEQLISCMTPKQLVDFFINDIAADISDPVAYITEIKKVADKEYKLCTE
jgi:hypothetical protein